MNDFRFKALSCLLSILLICSMAAMIPVSNASEKIANSGDGETENILYTSDEQIQIKAKHYLSYADDLYNEGREFKYSLLDASETVCDTAVADSDGNIAFSPITIDPDDTHTRLTYYVRAEHDYDDIDYDDNYIQYISFKVIKMENEDGSVSRIFTGVTPEPVFQDTYKPGSLSFTKETDVPTDEDFQFKLVKTTPKPILPPPVTPEEHQGSAWAAFYGNGIGTFPAHHVQGIQQNLILIFGEGSIPESICPADYSESSAFANVEELPLKFKFENIEYSSSAPWYGYQTNAEDWIDGKPSDQWINSELLDPSAILMDSVREIYVCTDIGPISCDYWFAHSLSNYFACGEPVNIDLSKFDLSNCRSSNYMFSCFQGNIVGLENLTTTLLKDTNSMFQYAKITSNNSNTVDFSAWNMSSLQHADNMFNGFGLRAYYPYTLNLSTWELPRLESAVNMFCSDRDWENGLRNQVGTIICQYDWNETTLLPDDAILFDVYCNITGEYGTNTGNDVSFAHPDATENPGRFSLESTETSNISMKANDAPLLVEHTNIQQPTVGNSASIASDATDDTTTILAVDGTDFISINDTGDLIISGGTLNTETVRDPNDYSVVTYHKWNDKYRLEDLYDKQSIRSVHIQNVKILDANNLFADYTKATSITFENVDTSTCTNMLKMFYNCRALKTLDLSSFDTSNVTTMNQTIIVAEGEGNVWAGENGSGMFENCYALESIDLSSFDTSKVDDFDFMFKNCRSLQELDLSNFVSDQMKIWYCEGGYIYSYEMYEMFAGCISLKTLDISQLDTSHTRLERFLFGCNQLRELYIGEDFTIYDHDSADQFKVLVPSQVNPLCDLSDTCNVQVFIGSEQLTKEEAIIRLGGSASTLNIFGEGSPDDIDISTYAENDIIYFHLFSGQTISFINFPAGSSYMLYELTPDGWTLTNQINTSGKIIPNQKIEASMENTQQEIPQDAHTSITIPGIKTLDGHPTGDFQFEILDEKGQNAALPVTSDENGMFSFNLEYGEEDVGKTFTYTVREISDVNDDAIEYDKREYDISVNVEKQGDKLAASFTGSNEEPVCIFRNVSAPGTLQIVKSVTNPSSADDQLVFNARIELFDSDGTVVRNDIIEISPNIPVDIEVPMGCSWRISETDIPESYILSNITNGTGTIQQAGETVTCIINNEYVAKGSLSVCASKDAIGFDLVGDDFEFSLMDGAGNTIEKVRNRLDGNIVFSNLDFDASDIGKEKLFYIAESKSNYVEESNNTTDEDYMTVNDAHNIEYDPTIYEILVKISDNGKGQLQFDTHIANIDAPEQETNAIFVNKVSTELPFTGETNYFLIVGLTIIIVMYLLSFMNIKREENKEKLTASK